MLAFLVVLFVIGLPVLCFLALWGLWGFAKDSQRIHRERWGHENVTVSTAWRPANHRYGRGWYVYNPDDPFD